MNQVKRKWDLLSEEKKRSCIDGVIAYFQTEKNEQIGFLAAEGILDMVLEMVSDSIYQKGVSDTRKIVDQKLEDLKVDLDVLGYEK